MTALNRLEKIRALRAVEGIDSDAGRELDSLPAAASQADSDDFDYAAAALDLALSGQEEPAPLPTALKARILAGAAEWFRARAAETSWTAAAAVVRLEDRTVRRDLYTPWAPWLLAAAAALVAIIGWWPRAATVTPGEVPAPLAIVESAPDALVRVWSTTDDHAAREAGGEVVWSTARQAGFLRLRGLLPNNPAVEQYQLWIFDRAQDERYPVDGGVFDMPPGADEAVVPIDAKIEVAVPYLFAITVEKPGGVVVSRRERVVLLAEV